ncbi:uncharacterized protein [Henckelia pumila]|uniref:uncharacterized protein n=1 Tax=Henckelia pumila TaxID=405737 RepID=UPI003C6DC3E1
MIKASGFRTSVETNDNARDIEVCRDLNDERVADYETEVYGGDNRTYDEYFDGVFFENELENGMNEHEVLVDETTEIDNVVTKIVEHVVNEENHVELTLCSPRNTQVASSYREDNHVDECALYTTQDTQVQDVEGNATYSFNDLSNFFVGQEFESKDEFQTELFKICLNASFAVDVRKSNKKFYDVRCVTPSCKWKIRASQIQNSSRFSIRVYRNIHTCDLSYRRKMHRQATSDFVAKILVENFKGQLSLPEPKIIITMMQNKGVEFSYFKAWRGRQVALDKLLGSPEESYRIMPSYLHMIERVNKDSKTDLVTDSTGRFKYMFLAYGACIDGFRRMRKVISVDGTFLKCKYRGCLLVATAQDGDFHQYPISWGIVDSENDDSWTWFLQKLKEFINDDPELVIISDRHISIINDVRTVYGHASHVHCSWHLSQNLKRVSGGKGGVDLFMKTTYAYKVSEFDEFYICLKERYPNIASYLEMHSSPDKWSRAHSPGARYNIMTTNGVESINATLKNKREMPVVALLDAIHKLTSKWFNKHRKAASSATMTLTPSTEAILRANFTVSQRLKASQLNAFEYQVFGDGKNEVVNLSDKSCSCRVFQVDKLPYAHAIAAIYFAKLDLYDFCSPYYLSQMWALAYAGTIYLVPISSEWNIPNDLRYDVVPPDVKRKHGRSQKERIPSIGEFGRKRSKKCGVCHESGHYRKKCPQRQTDM